MKKGKNAITSKHHPLQNKAMPTIFLRIFLVSYLLNSLPQKNVNNLSPPSLVTVPPATLMDAAELRRVFQMFDRNGDGRITTKELNDLLEKIGILNPDSELTQLIKKIEANGDGCVDIDEFGGLYQSIMEERDDEEEDMRKAFGVFDRNSDGFITVEELRSVLGLLRLKQGRSAEDQRQGHGY